MIALPLQPIRRHDPVCSRGMATSAVQSAPAKGSGDPAQERAP